MITVVGTGLESGDITVRGKKAIKSALELYSRTKTRYKSQPLCEKFSQAESYEQLDEYIVEFLLVRAEQCDKVVYITMGDGFGDTVVKKLSEKTRTEIIPGVADNRSRLPSGSFMTLSAYDIGRAENIDTRFPLLVYQIDDKFVAGDVKLALMKFYPDDYRVRLTSGKTAFDVKLSELDHADIRQGSSIYLDEDVRLVGKKRYGYCDLLYIMKRLTAPDGCPWDRAQTHESIAVNMLEEAYEAVDAINRGDTENLKEELGDVILQAVFHADMSEKEGDFDINDVINDLCVKLVSRHTHIFGKNKADNAEEALFYWEKAKAKEKHYSTLAEQLNRLPENFPAAMLLYKFVRKANKAGADITAEKLKGSIMKNLDGADENSMKKLLSAAVMLAAVRDMPAEELMLKEFAELKSTADAQDCASAAEKVL